jgi:hypothetical protein
MWHAGRQRCNLLPISGFSVGRVKRHSMACDVPEKIGDRLGEFKMTPFQGRAVARMVVNLG